MPWAAELCWWSSHGKFCAHVGIKWHILCSLTLKSPPIFCNCLQINAMYKILVYSPRWVRLAADSCWWCSHDKFCTYIGISCSLKLKLPTCFRACLVHRHKFMQFLIWSPRWVPLAAVTLMMQPRQISCTCRHERRKSMQLELKSPPNLCKFWLRITPALRGLGSAACLLELLQVCVDSE